jgi:hypothetical protein
VAGYSGKSIVQKLGIKPGFRIFTAGLSDAYRDIVGELPADVTIVSRLKAPLDTVHVFATQSTGLAGKLRSSRTAIAPDDPGVKAWREFMIKYVPDGDLHDTNYVNSYNSAMALEAVLKACGDDLSTENILKQAYSIHDLELPMLLPGIKVNTSPTDHVPVDQMQFMRFNGKTWERFGELQTGN